VSPRGGIPGVLQRLVVAPASGLQQPATTERPPVTARHVPVAEAVGVRAVGDRLLVGCLDHAPVRIFDAPISLRLLRVVPEVAEGALQGIYFVVHALAEAQAGAR